MPRLFFISFIDFGEMKSGSSVRPQRMYAAFKKLGYQITLLSGLQNRRIERWKNVFAKYRELRTNLPELCYVEPPSGPFFNLCDHLLLLWLKAKGVPTGLFYRDAYWLFADFWPVKGVKRVFLRLMHRFDLLIIRHTCKVVFFPSETMSGLFRFGQKSILPPAGMDAVVPVHRINHHALYVGGVSAFYGTDILLGAFRILNEERGKHIRLTVVCRENEMKHFFDGYLDKGWLEVLHLSGDEALTPLYEQCDIALYPSRRDFYMDFCMPVKLFEYLSRALPVVSTDCKETARFVNENGIGVSAESTPESFADAVQKMFEQPELLARCRENAVKALRSANLWEHRAQKAAREILRD